MGLMDFNETSNSGAFTVDRLRCLTIEMKAFGVRGPKRAFALEGR
jgi:hypothetical protein